MITLKFSEVPADQAFQRLQPLFFPYFRTPTRETLFSVQLTSQRRVSTMRGPQEPQEDDLIAIYNEQEPFTTCPRSTTSGTVACQ
jgi:hypothetical protein